MLLNGSPLNSVPLNGATGSGSEPIYIVAGQAFNWRLRLLVGGDDLTGQLTGAVDVDREENAAGVAGFTVCLPPGPVVPTDWLGKAVAIDYISRDRDGLVTEARLYTGQLEMPAWNATSRLLGCECSDGVQQRVEAMPIEAIDAQVGGTWSPDVFEPVEGRSRWDYAQERLSTRPAALDCSPTGEIRVTNWAAQSPHYVFGPGTTLHESLQIELQPHGAVINRVEIEVDYRWSRLYQFNQAFEWAHPNASPGGFCQWRVWTTDLPTTEMFVEGVESASMKLVGGVTGNRLPLSAADPCLTGQPWKNTYNNLWLVASVSGARRWAQTVTEHYTLTLTAPGGEDGSSTQVISRDSAAFEIESDRVEEWQDADPDGDTRVESLADEARRTEALTCLLHRGATELLDAHRGTTVSWQVPTDLVLGIDLIHTLQLSDFADATGKCRRIQHQLDLGAGTAITTLSIAVSRGGGENDPLVVPAAPDTDLPPLDDSSETLQTQLGGRLNNPVTGNPIPPYDEELPGFSGNWDAKDDLTAEEFPRQLRLESLEIGAEYTDEATGEVATTYRVGIPNDQLEL
ncbi:hypothetical protein D9M68_254080 [compost metagenome]